MRKIFQKWLFVFVLLSFASTIGISYVFQTKLADKRALDLIRLNLQYVQKQISLNEANLNALKNDLQTELLEKAKTLALTLKEDAALLKHDAFLKNWAKSGNLEEINIVDNKGIVTYAEPAVFVGTDFNQYPETQKYLPLITDKKKIHVEDIRISVSKDGAQERWVLFAGIPRLDEDGIIQTGYSAERYANALRTASVENLAPDFSIGNTGFVLIAKDGKIISATNRESIGKTLEQVGLSAVENGYFHATVENVPSLVVFEKSSDYTLIGVYPEKELYAHRNNILFWSLLFYVVLYVVVFVMISVLLERIVIRGIKHTNGVLEKITAGDLNERVDIRTSEEFISLSDGINATVTALKQAIADAAARIDKELEFAREIQKSSLPSTFPPYPETNDFDVYALMRPAKEVGGDFYDFFLLGAENTHLGVVIADVSGKGIPAALFMMSAKTLIKNYAEAGLSPDEIFTHANKELCENNEAGMFVTAFMGILEIATGRFVYVNAGHNPPYLKRVNGNFEQMKLKPGFMLGGLDSIRYEQNETVLNAGDALFLYTDGVTEAKDVHENLFGDARLLKVLNEHKTERFDDLVRSVDLSVREFSYKAEQADDVTMLCLAYNSQTRSFPAKIDMQDTAMEFINDVMRGHACSQKIIAQMDIAFEEIFVNIASYAYAPHEGDVEISCAVGGSPEFITLIFKDSGRPFNPLKKPDPDITLGIEEREIGNLGIFMVKQMMDSVTYEYKDGYNILILKKNTAQETK